MSVPKKRTPGPTIRQQEEMSDAMRRARYELAAKNPTIVAKGKGRERTFPPQCRAALEGRGAGNGDARRKPHAQRTLSREFTGDRWAQGRYLAAILSVWIDELRADAAHGSGQGSPAEAQDQELGRWRASHTMSAAIVFTCATTWC
jgi:hypothetical protein